MKKSTVLQTLELNIAITCDGETIQFDSEVFWKEWTTADQIVRTTFSYNGSSVRINKERNKIMIVYKVAPRFASDNLDEKTPIELLAEVQRNSQIYHEKITKGESVDVGEIPEAVKKMIELQMKCTAPLSFDEIKIEPLAKLNCSVPNVDEKKISGFNRCYFSEKEKDKCAHSRK